MKWNPEDYTKNSDAQLKWAQELRSNLNLLRSQIKPAGDRSLRIFSINPLLLHNQLAKIAFVARFLAPGDRLQR